MASRRNGRAALTKAQLLPLSTEKIRALSLENHLALSVVHAGAGAFEQMSCLLRAVYLAYFMRNETTAGMNVDVYRRAEAVMGRCIGRVERGETWTLESNEVAELERVLGLHDEQLAAVPLHRYQSAWERLQRFITSGQRSPIPAVATV
ncbi:hypothetical protein [Burkholderia ubonensis]|uniref:hypothetical protein n=1 Tax=Burkholderia ubonensis TaxID=101571 RepID=UPI0007578756|nr:hypothetical protein [Burkholderia ubonensis]KVL70480.1 hypothetical protein WJ49_23465 [Burkholderia ubonensis]KVL73342.1 hypothetical protein WJ48_01160 [Burkholderia ubonensis]KVL91170.1 hypothetical protein WJ50_13595 [Burkholderia ubonensis]